MPGPGEDDRDAVDRAFADLVAKFHLTAERGEPTHSAEPAGDAASSTVSTSNEAVSTSNEAVSGVEQPSVQEHAAPDAGWADSEPLFRFADPVPAAERSEPEERFVPEPPLPLRRPAWPVLVAWLAMGYAVLAVLATALGVRLPVWAGWLALAGFVGGFGLLVARLPRHRPPDAGDGAVL